MSFPRILLKFFKACKTALNTLACSPCLQYGLQFRGAKHGSTPKISRAWVRCKILFYLLKSGCFFVSHSGRRKSYPVLFSRSQVVFLILSISKLYLERNRQMNYSYAIRSTNENSRRPQNPCERALVSEQLFSALEVDGTWNCGLRICGAGLN